MVILQRFYYPVIEHLGVADVTEDIPQNLPTIISKLIDQTDLPGNRIELYRSLQVVAEVYDAILIRCRQKPQTELYRKYQEFIVFPELDSEVDRIFGLIKGLFPMMIDGGHCDQRVAVAYLQILYSGIPNDFNSSKLKVSKKWISRNTSTYGKGKSRISRYIRVIATTQYMNRRMCGLALQQHHMDPLYSHILLALCFSQNTQSEAII